jgi:PhzF family phenazine biosynthesis protein
MMEIQRIAAFTRDDEGGNPAGVVLCDVLPGADRMQTIAAEVGYSETVFAAPSGGGYRVRYFAPQVEVPFCGHATIALGAALARREGSGSFTLHSNAGLVRVDGRFESGRMSATLHSPPTRSEPASAQLLEAALQLFSLSPVDLDAQLPTAVIEAGARHLLIPLYDRQRLMAMRYDLPAGADMMRLWGLTTISLVFQESGKRFHSRNPFAAGGVYEDPATGAAAAALVAYLHQLGRRESGCIEILQGEDMGAPCLLHAQAPSAPGGSARVYGSARDI